MFPSSCKPCPKCPSQDKGKDRSSFPPSTLRRVVYDYATTPRDDFFQQFDIGVPKDATVQDAEDVLILYSSNRSLPTALKRNKKTDSHHLESVLEATENCQSMKVVLVEPTSFKRASSEATQCLALVPQWASPYIYKFMRLPNDGGDFRGKRSIDDALPLRYVSRTHQENGVHRASVPSLQRHTLPSLKVLSEYVKELPHAQERLRSLLNNTDNRDPLIVMTCNKGQSELLVNFVCSASSRNLSMDRVIVFATDEHTYHLCQSLQLPYCYHDLTLFSDIPQEAAEYFGDDTFAKVMKAKVYCVHLILTLGYSVLFMDVDDLRYAPFSPNSGFYFVRHTSKTMFLFGELLKMGDTISLYHSHQHALSQLVNEHVSWTGLRVKVLPTGYGNPFPGGFEFNRRYPYMKDLLGNADTKEDPYIFHMCWTESAEYKRPYFQQMGEWYVRDGYESGSCSGIGCCENEPKTICHFRDMPSAIPCVDSPPVDEDDPGDSFW
ncbi:nucleotide-diphospho-sugar transferase [Nitzschia inconspicua]|uniref:Nucleotide-diphospho-sugar transferase n=1 Tax=Nitzschia inconspicua TaxID=303405 RepID=A0A9K3LBX3_9STRA|nr:nucleotide-diphospho-sugar transferase [Nitzschia inconspicua]